MISLLGNSKLGRLIRRGPGRYIPRQTIDPVTAKLTVKPRSAVNPVSQISAAVEEARELQARVAPPVIVHSPVIPDISSSLQSLEMDWEATRGDLLAIGPPDEPRAHGRWTKGGDTAPSSVQPVPKFKTDKEAMRWSKLHLGVTVQYGEGTGPPPDHPELGLSITSATVTGLAKGKELGLAIPPVVEITPYDGGFDFFGPTAMPESVLAATGVHPLDLKSDKPLTTDKIKLMVNPVNPSWYDLPYWMGKLKSDNFMSTGSLDHAIVHELAHVQHALQNQHAFSNNHSTELTPKEEHMAQLQVSKYGASQANEFVAEVFTAMKLDNKQFPPEVMSVYKKYGGPK